MKPRSLLLWAIIAFCCDAGASECNKPLHDTVQELEKAAPLELSSKHAPIRTLQGATIYTLSDGSLVRVDAKGRVIHQRWGAKNHILRTKPYKDEVGNLFIQHPDGAVYVLRPDQTKFQISPPIPQK